MTGLRNTHDDSHQFIGFDDMAYGGRLSNSPMDNEMPILDNSDVRHDPVMKNLM